MTAWLGSLGRATSFGTLALALFLMAGNFKGDARLAWLPIDLTLLAALLTIAACAVAFIERGFSVPPRLHWMAALFLLLAIPVMWTDLTGDYTADKVIKLFGFTLLSAFAPFFLLQRVDDQRRFLNALAVLGLLMVLEAFYKLVSGGPMMRLTGFDATTIALARAAGVVVIWFAVLAFEARLPSLVSLPIVSIAAIIMLFSGSRGPCLSALLILGYIGVAFYRSRLRQGLRFGATLALVGVALYLSASYAPSMSVGRMVTLAQGDLGGSEMTRVSYYAQSLELVQRHPFGLGWGGFALESGSGGGDLREYPHNFVLETLVEAGWAAGLFLVGVCLVAWRRVSSLASSAEARALLGMFLYMIFNAMVSGDLNDNKMLFGILAACLVYQASESAHDVEEELQVAVAPVRG